MTTVYSENPSNWNAVESYVNKGDFTRELFLRKACYFYDACSFRYHANLCDHAAKKISEFMKRHDGLVVLTRCVLMELASVGGVLHPAYIRYFKNLDLCGLHVYVIYEEDLFEVLAGCFSTYAKVNSFLMWATRMMKSPVSTITVALEEEEGLAETFLKGKHLDDRGLFRRFFSAVRRRKEPGDHLGEELLGICLYMLSQLPGEEEGKFCLMTDDKGAAGKIDALFQRTPAEHRGKRIILFSTPKLAQTLYKENDIQEKECLLEILDMGSGGCIKVLGTQIYDLRSTILSLQREELADQIIQQKIHITF